MKKAFGLLILISLWGCSSLLLSCNSASSGEQKVSHAEKTAFGDSLIFKEVTHLDLKGYYITVKEEAGENKTFLIAYNKIAKKADTAEISGREFEDAELNILDASDSLQIKPLLLEITTPSGSDWYSHSFVGYDSGKLKELFELSDFPGPARLNLHRKDNWTLAGSVSERDDLVAALEEYPVEVSLKDYKVTFPNVPALYIGWVSKVLTGFKARRVGNEQLADSIFTVKKGTQLVVDTLYTNLGKVRLVIHDSIILEIPMDKLKGKITENSAG